MKKIVLSDESINCYGFRVLTSGIDLEQYRKNPIILFMHQRSDEDIMPIGRMTELSIEGDKLVGVPVFDLNDPLAAKVADKYENGFLNMASIGFETLETSDAPELIMQGQRGPTVTRCKLLEVSIVDIGANDNAVVVNDDTVGELSAGKVFTLKYKTSLNNRTMTQPINARLLSLLMLNAGATEESVISAVEVLMAKVEGLTAQNTALTEENEKFKAEAKLAREQETATMINEAVKDGRLKQENIATFTEIAEKAGNEVLRNALSALQRPVKPTDIINQELKAEDIPDWDTEDKKGTLAKIKKEQPEVFALMFSKKFGKK